MHANDDRIIRIPRVDAKANYLAGFWSWVQVLADNDYQRAFDGLWWPPYTSWTADTLKERITTVFGFGSPAPWFVVVPNDRLIGVVDDAAQWQPKTAEGHGWLLAQIPLTTEPADPKNDEISLMGLAASFFLRPFGEHYVMELEIFHA